MTLFVGSCKFALALFLCTLIIHSPLVLSSPVVVQSHDLTRLRVLKERITVQIVDGKENLQHAYNTELLFHLTPASSIFKFVRIFSYSTYHTK